MNVIALPVSYTPSASSVVRTVLHHGLRSALRSRGVLIFGIAMFLVAEAVLRLAGSGSRAMVSMLQVVLLVVPLVSMTFGVIAWHASREFNELLLTQPVDRRSLFTGLYLGLVTPLAGAFLIGASLPFLIHRAITPDALPLFFALIGSGVALAFVFGGLAILIGVLIDDRLRAVGIALMVWLLLTVAYDGLVLLVATTLADYPLERPMLALTLANPVDLARVLIVLQSDNAAMMGYTGAVMSRFLGSAAGTTLALAAMAVWILLPALAGRRAFARRDF